MFFTGPAAVRLYDDHVDAVHRYVARRLGPELAGPLGKQQVDVNLHVSKKAIEIEIEKMRSPTDYLIKAKADLENGWYAFQTQELLDNPNQEDFDRIPEELRQVYPFEYVK